LNLTLTAPIRNRYMVSNYAVTIRRFSGSIARASCCSAQHNVIATFPGCWATSYKRSPKLNEFLTQ
jgi:hypothetical protein